MGPGDRSAAHGVSDSARGAADVPARGGGHGGAHGGSEPSPWIVRHAQLVAPDARVLDLACGEGRHARYFAARGCTVLAVDRNDAAMAQLAGVPRVETRRLDLERGSWPLTGEVFDAIVVVNYLHRPAFTYLLDALAADGVLLYETFAQGNEVYGRPSNPDFLLQVDELWERVVPRLRVVAFEQGRVERAGGPAVVQRVAAIGMRRAWPPALAST